MAQHIAQKKDLGYKGSGQVATINEDKITCSTSLKEKFWSLLGCEKGSESGMTLNRSCFLLTDYFVAQMETSTF